MAKRTLQVTLQAVVGRVWIISCEQEMILRKAEKLHGWRIVVAVQLWSAWTSWKSLGVVKFVARGVGGLQSGRESGKLVYLNPLLRGGWNPSRGAEYHLDSLFDLHAATTSASPLWAAIEESLCHQLQVCPSLDYACRLFSNHRCVEVSS